MCSEVREEIQQLLKIDAHLKEVYDLKHKLDTWFKVEMKTVLFQCLDCHGTDEVPEYVIGEFSVEKIIGMKWNFIVRIVMHYD